MTRPPTKLQRDDLLRNAEFEEPGDRPTELSGAGTAGRAAASGWATVNHSDATTTTRVVPKTEGGGGQMLEVCSTGASNGLVQVFGESGAGPGSSVASATVFILKGSVGLGVGNGGATSVTTVASATDQWLVLEVEHDDLPVDQFVLFSASDGDTCFLVDRASVEAAASPRVLLDTKGDN